MANAQKSKNVDEFGRPLLRIGEAAEYLGVGAATIRAYSDGGRLAYTRTSDRPNAQRLYKIADLERFGRENYIRRRKATIEEIDFGSMPDSAEIGINQAAKYLDISSMTIRNYVRNGSIPCTRKGGRNAMVFKKGDLDKFAAAHTDMRRRAKHRPSAPANFDFSFDMSDMTQLTMLVCDKDRTDNVIDCILSAGYSDNALYSEMHNVAISADGIKHDMIAYKVECNVPKQAVNDAVNFVVKYLDSRCDKVTYSLNDASANEDDTNALTD